MKNESNKKAKKYLLILVLISVGILIYENYPFPSRVLITPSNSKKIEFSPEITKVEIESPKAKLKFIKQEVKKNEDEKTIDDLAKEYKRDELELLKNTSKIGVHFKLVNEFIKRSRLAKTRELQLNIAKEMSGNNFRLSLEFVRFTNKKFPQDKIINPKAPGTPFKPKNIFKNIKKE